MVLKLPWFLGICFLVLGLMRPIPGRGEEAPPKADEEAVKPHLDLDSEQEDEVSLTLIQRWSKPIPKSDETLTLKIGDITGRMVIVSIRNKKKTILRDTPITIGETVPFEIAGQKYAVLLESLDNKLVGDDQATLKILNQSALEKHEANADKQIGLHTLKFGESIETNISGKLTALGISKRGNADLRINIQRFTVGTGHWSG